MKVIVHDLQEESWQELGIKFNEKDIVIGEGTGGGGSSIGAMIGSCCQLVLISRCVYGGFSPFIQGVLEKCRERFSLFWNFGTVRHIIRLKTKIKILLVLSAVFMAII